MYLRVTDHSKDHLGGGGSVHSQGVACYGVGIQFSFETVLEQNPEQ